MPCCPRCRKEVPIEIESSCAACDEEDIRRAQEAYEDFLNYEGDDYLSQPLEDGQTKEEARQEAQDPRTIQFVLSFGGLEYILKDRWATRGLLDALIQGDARVLKALEAYAVERVGQLGRAKPGPRPDPATGKYKIQAAAELQAQGLNPRQIAKALYDDPTKT